MASTVELIKVLKERTGAGIMDCKHALEASEFDIDKASDWLREKGIAKQASKASRIAAEGLAVIHVCEQCGNVSVLELNCETDFVAKSDPFRALTVECATKVLTDNVKDVDSLNEIMKVQFAEATVKLGEKLSLRRFEKIEKQEGQGIGTYIHMGGTIAVVVVLNKEEPQLAKGIAMQIAANNPKYIAEENIPADVLEAETKVQIEACKNDPKLANKPEAALQNIVKGKVHKVLAEQVLCDQEYLLDGSKTVGQVLKENNVSVLKFIRYQVGEGIEKRHDDFAAEVAAQSK